MQSHIYFVVQENCLGVTENLKVQSRETIEMNIKIINLSVGWIGIFETWSPFLWWRAKTCFSWKLDCWVWVCSFSRTERSQCWVREELFLIVFCERKGFQLHAGSDRNENRKNEKFKMMITRPSCRTWSWLSIIHPLIDCFIRHQTLI